MSFQTITAQSITDVDKVNSNFDNLEGTRLPFNNVGPTTGVYDLGTATSQWRVGYFNTLVFGSGFSLSGFDTTNFTLPSGILDIATAGIRGSTANAGGQSREIANVSMDNIRSGAVLNFSTSVWGTYDVISTTITAHTLPATRCSKVLIMAKTDVQMTLEPEDGSGISFFGRFYVNRNKPNDDTTINACYAPLQLNCDTQNARDWWDTIVMYAIDDISGMTTGSVNITYTFGYATSHNLSGLTLNCTNTSFVVMELRDC